MIDRYLMGLLIWITALVGICMLRRRSPLHPMTIALGTTATIGSFYPILSIWFEPRTWRNSANAADEVVRAVQLDHWTFCLGLLLGFPPPGQTCRARKTDQARALH